MKPVLTGSEQRPHEPRRQSSGENRFPPTLAVVIAAALYTLLPDPIRLGPRLVVPAVEVVPPPAIGEPEIQEVAAALRSGWLSTGPRVACGCTWPGSRAVGRSGGCSGARTATRRGAT